MTIKNEFKEIIGSFSCEHILRDATESERQEVRRMQNRDSYAKIAISAFVFICIQCFFIISDILTDFYTLKQYAYLNLTAEIIIICSSAATMLYFWVSKDRDSNNIRLVHFLYYFCLETGFILYFASDLFRGLDNVMNVFFNLILLAIFSVYSMRAMIALFVYMSGAAVILIFAYSHTLSWEKYQLIPLVLLLFFFCACFFRARNTKLFYTQVKLITFANDLKDVSTKDFLTKLPNRTALGEFLDKEIKHAIKHKKSVGLMMADIDDFKAYNTFIRI